MNDLGVVVEKEWLMTRSGNALQVSKLSAITITFDHQDEKEDEESCSPLPLRTVVDTHCKVLSLLLVSRVAHRQPYLHMQHSTHVFAVACNNILSIDV